MLPAATQGSSLKGAHILTAGDDARHWVDALHMVALPPYGCHRLHVHTRCGTPSAATLNPKP